MQTLKHQKCMNTSGHWKLSRSDWEHSWSAIMKWFVEAIWILSSSRYKARVLGFNTTIFSGISPTSLQHSRPHVGWFLESYRRVSKGTVLNVLSKIRRSLRKKHTNLARVRKHIRVKFNDFWWFFLLLGKFCLLGVPGSAASSRTVILLSC